MPKKRSIFLDKGIFHNGGVKILSTLKAIRHSYSKKRGFERVVLDFKTKKIPRIYGYISPKQKKLYLDIFDTKITQGVKAFGNSKYVDTIKFFPLNEETLSAEFIFKKKVAVDIFYLDSPGRLVIDIKS